MILSLQNISRTYSSGNQELNILQNANLELSAGECIALVGPSGVGKTTLLQIAGLLDKPDTGSVSICDQIANNLNDKAKSALRNKYLGFVFQNHMLMAEFTALENVMMPLIINNTNRDKAKQAAQEILQSVGLADRINHQPATMSGGEQQRVAVARALVHKPKLLIADEPTGNLDVHTTTKVFELILKLVREQNISAIIATHSQGLAEQMDKIITLKDGRIEDLKVAPVNI